ncbi:MAG: hypothetical protein JST96_05980 [Bacteroidetes bacterium]|nr:hypothetical protein [Bacteroidota bacterium]
MKNKNVHFFFILCIVLCLYKKTTAQTSVHDEPHHKTVLENQYVRLLDLNLLPGDTTLWHKHDAESVVVFLSNSILAIQNANEEPLFGSIKPGDVVYRNYGEKPVIHRVWTAGQNSFRCMVAEVNNNPATNDSCNNLSLTGSKLVWKQKHVSAYRKDIFKGEKFNLVKSNCAYLVFVYSGFLKIIYEGNSRFFAAGSFVFVPPNSTAEIDNASNEDASCVLLEMNSRR